MLLCQRQLLLDPSEVLPNHQNMLSRSLEQPMRLILLGSWDRSDIMPDLPFLHLSVCLSSLLLCFIVLYPGL
jgi:hypothetical protein